MSSIARCKHCGDTIESKGRHDIVQCSCLKEYDTNGGHGFYLNGGDDYCRCGGNFDDIEWVALTPGGTLYTKE